MELCELLPHTAGIADDITLIRSMNTESVDHEAALRLIHSGQVLRRACPAWGSWVDLWPGHREREPAGLRRARPIPAGCRSTASATGPAAGCRPSIRGRRSARAGRRCSTCKRPTGLSPAARANQLAFLGRAQPRAPRRAIPSNTELEARIDELRNRRPHADRRARACSTSPAKPPRPRALYGLDNPATREYGTPLPDGPPAGRAGRAVRADLPERPALGHAQQERREPQGTVRQDRSAERGPGAGPEAARACSIRRS